MMMIKGEVNPEMKLSQSMGLFLPKRMPPIRNPSGLNSAVTHPCDVIDTAIDWELIGTSWFFKLFEKPEPFQVASFQEAFVGPFYASNDGF